MSLSLVGLCVASLPVGSSECLVEVCLKNTEYYGFWNESMFYCQRLLGSRASKLAWASAKRSTIETLLYAIYQIYSVKFCLHLANMPLREKCKCQCRYFPDNRTINLDDTSSFKTFPVIQHGSLLFFFCNNRIHH